MSTWRPITTAPVETVLLVRAGPLLWHASQHAGVWRCDRGEVVTPREWLEIKDHQQNSTNK